jgi:hypothetical protein
LRRDIFIVTGGHGTTCYYIFGGIKMKYRNKKEALEEIKKRFEKSKDCSIYVDFPGTTREHNIAIWISKNEKFPFHVTVLGQDNSRLINVTCKSAKEVADKLLSESSFDTDIPSSIKFFDFEMFGVKNDIVLHPDDWHLGGVLDDIDPIDDVVKMFID